VTKKAITDTTKLSSELHFAVAATNADPVEPPGCVCANCGHEQPTMAPCAKCRSVRVVLVSVIRDLFGEDWRSAFAPEAP
jgi:hypothetical protein